MSSARRPQPEVGSRPPSATIGTGTSTTSQRQAHAQVPAQAQAQLQFELGVALALALWPALTLAVQQEWGGNSSADKRDWFAGAVVDLFGSGTPIAQTPARRHEIEVEDVEEFLLQVMLDEFEVNVDDESAMQTAQLVVRLWRDCNRGEFGEVVGLKDRWERGGRRAGEGKFEMVGGDEKDDDEDEDEDEDDTDDDEEENEDDDGDIEMGDAPPERAREKVQPEVDEDGFTKVKRKR